MSSANEQPEKLDDPCAFPIFLVTCRPQAEKRSRECVPFWQPGTSGPSLKACPVLHTSPSSLPQPQCESRSLTTKATIYSCLYSLTIQKARWHKPSLRSAFIDPLFDTMREWGEKRPHSPDTTSAPRPSARKRTRVGGKARNINKVVWRKVQQHLLWRNKSHMETEVFIDDVKQDFSNVRRRIVRAGATEIEHVKGMQIVAPY